MMATQRKPRPKGFAAMDPERVREIAGLGGRAAHALGRAHVFTSEEARAAGKKGKASQIASRAKQTKRPKQLSLPV